MADVLIVESDSAIKAQDGSSVKALRYVNGRKSGDLQYYPSSSTPPYGTTEDLAFTWTVNSPGSGYWVRVSDYASPHFWGADAVSGTAAANKTAVQSAFTFCAAYAIELRFDWDGSMLVNDELTISGPFNISGAGRNRTILRQTGTGKNLIRITGSVTDAAWRSFGLSCDSDAGHVLCMGAVSSYTITAINTTAKTFTVSGTGASTTIAQYDAIRVRGGGVNNRTYTVSAITTSGGNTVITVLEAIASGTVAGSVEWMAAQRFTRVLLEDMYFQQQNTANSIVYGIWNNTGGFTLNRFDHVKFQAEPGHNCPLIDIAANGNFVQSDVFTDVWAHFDRSTAQVPNDVAGLDYVARFACHGAATFFDQMTFDKWLVEQADGGVIHLIGCNHSTIRNVQMFDNGPVDVNEQGAKITKHLIKLESNADSTPQVSRMNLLEMIVRHSGNLTSGIYDIWIDSSTDANILVACQGTAADPLEIQFNSNKAVLIGNKYRRSTTTRT